MITTYFLLQIRAPGDAVLRRSLFRCPNHKVSSPLIRSNLARFFTTNFLLRLRVLSDKVCLHAFFAILILVLRMSNSIQKSYYELRVFGDVFLRKSLFFSQILRSSTYVSGELGGSE